MRTMTFLTKKRYYFQSSLDYSEETQLGCCLVSQIFNKQCIKSSHTYFFGTLEAVMELSIITQHWEMEYLIKFESKAVLGFNV